MCCNCSCLTKVFCCFGSSQPETEEDEEQLAENASSSGCCRCFLFGDRQVWPQMEGVHKQGEVYNFSGGVLRKDWKKRWLVLTKTETEAPVLHLYKDKPGGKLQHDVLLPAAARDMRFGTSCQLYGKFAKSGKHFKTKYKQMIAIPERYCDRADPYIIWLWIPSETEFVEWRKLIGEKLEELRIDGPPMLEILEEDNKHLYHSQTRSKWENYWLQLELI